MVGACGEHGLEMVWELGPHAVVVVGVRPCNVADGSGHVQLQWREECAVEQLR